MAKRTLASAAYLLSLSGIFLALIACGGENGITGPKGSSTVTLTLNGLEPLGEGLVYRGWMVGGDPGSYFGVPIVTFDIGEQGEMVDPVSDTVMTGPFRIEIHPDQVLAIGVSLELQNELSDYSSYTFILAGDLQGGTVNLTTDNWLAFDVSMAEVEGNFVLATPTDSDPENELSGLWFMDPASGSGSPGLTLPEAPVGWDYEGWVMIDDQPVSTGKFFTRGEVDLENPYSGSLPGPLFPGEDFLANPPTGMAFPTDLSGSAVFVTMEPWDNWDVDLGRPFFLRVLEAQIPMDAEPGTLYPMTRPVSQLPGGTATVAAWSASSGASG